MFGLLNLHKPIGWTSRDVVNRVQKLVRPDKAGHAGTLDPLAEGVLVVCIGAATRLIEYVQARRKTYRAAFRFGESSATDDLEGRLVKQADAPRPTREEVVAAAARFVGTIDQTPPAYSAVKVAGRRAYDLARRGEEVALAARPVEIHRIDVTGYEYPDIELDIECGSGTYVRSLGRDLAAALGTVAVMTSLVRTSIGEFLLADAVAVDSLSRELIEARLLPAATAISDLPQITLTPTERTRIARGQAIERDGLSPGITEYAALEESGALCAILTPRGTGWLSPTRCFIAEHGPASHGAGE